MAAEREVSPADLRALVLDAWQEPGLKAMTEGPQPLAFTGGHFTINEDASVDGALCDAYRRFGRVLGFQRTGFPADDSDEPPVAFPRLDSAVDLFQTPAGASDYVAWMASAAGARALQDSSGGEPWLATRLPDSGAGALLLSAQSPGVARVALVPHGRFVGVVEFVPGGAGMPTVDLPALARRVAARLRAAKPAGEPYGARQLLAATLPLAAWGERFQSLTADGYSGIEAWDDGTTQVQESFEADLDWDDPDAISPLRIATAMGLYPDPRAAVRAATDLHDEMITSPGFVRFPVAEPRGGFGYRVWSTEGGEPADEWEGGYTWGVLFTRGPVLGRVWLEFGEVEQEAQLLDRATVLAVAARLATNIVAVLELPDVALQSPELGTDSIPQSRVAAPSPGPAVSPFPLRPWSDIEVGPAPQSSGRLSIEGSTTCALDRSGVVWCWGGSVVVGGEEQLAIPTAVPTRASDGRRMTRLAGSCGLDASGRAWCWRLGQAPSGRGGTEPAAAIAGDLRLIDLAIGDQLSCALDGDRQAWCWQRWTQEADPDDPSDGTATQPVLVPGDHRFTAIETGAYHACGIDELRRAWCWGMDDSGQLGDGGDSAPSFPYPEPTPTPVAVVGGHTFTAIAAGWGHTCALDSGGAAWCWGDDGDGQVGDGTAIGPPKRIPYPVDTQARFTRLASGGSRTCGIDTLGRAWCWGGRDPAPEGEDMGRVRDRPTLVPGGHRFVDLAVGDDHACGVDAAGRAWCWGSSGEGRLGDGVVMPSYDDEGVRVAPEHLVPVAVIGGHTFQVP